jgi:hypothetical protein
MFLYVERAFVFKRLLWTVIAGLGIGGSASAQEQFTIGHNEVTAPAGWRQVNKTEDRLVLRSSDQHQQATLSVVRLSSDATFEEFNRLCQLRIDAERKELGDGFIEPEAPKPAKDGDGRSTR